ncbi:hypothetical protein LCGC14_0850630 [marine sediment metagenome]|uniref:Uncharacterized protein n=1 Tax=marine sediment metagenome TaxID=412755 RepID=A0A0F9PAI7_9ZZZZ
MTSWTDIQVEPRDLRSGAAPRIANAHYGCVTPLRNTMRYLQEQLEVQWQADLELPPLDEVWSAVLSRKAAP